jgi:hypothetical protein
VGGGIAGALIGVVVLLALPRFLPFSLDSRVAGLVMGRDRVGGGRAMIEAADPAGHPRHDDRRMGLRDQPRRAR